MPFLVSTDCTSCIFMMDMVCTEKKCNNLLYFLIEILSHLEQLVQCHFCPDLLHYLPFSWGCLNIIHCVIHWDESHQSVKRYLYNFAVCLLEMIVQLMCFILLYKGYILLFIAITSFDYVQGLFFVFHFLWFVINPQANQEEKNKQSF